MIILIYLILISFSLFLLFRYDERIEDTLPYTFILIIIFLFLMGLIGLLKASVYIVAILGCLSFLYVIYVFIKVKNRRKILKKIFTPGFVIYNFFFIFFLFYHHGRLLTNWDEFTHWGDVVKVMYTINDFSTNSKSLSAFQTYLPGISLFQYFFQVLIGKFNESYLFFSNHLLFISFLLPFTKKFEWNKPLKIIISVISYVLVPIILFNSFYKTIYVDCLLGIVFGFVLVNIYLSRDNFDKKAIVKISLSLIMLSLVKDIGIFLGFICLFIAFVFFCISSIKKKKFVLKDYYPFLIMTISNFLFYFLWQLKVKIDGAVTSWSNPLNISFIADSLLGRNDVYGIHVRNYFFTMCREYSLVDGFFRFNTFSIIFVFIIVFSFIYRKNNKKDIKAKSFCIDVVIGVFGYLFLLLILYLWKFSEYEAIQLASWNRYVGTVFEGLFYFLTVIVIDETLLKKEIFNKNLLIMFIILVLGINPFDIKALLHRDVYSTIAFRKPFNMTSEIVSTNLKNEKKSIYFVSQYSQGLDYWIFKYTNRNNINNINTGFTWSLGEKYDDNDIWTTNISSDEWLEILLEDYDYVYLFRVDDKFIDNFGLLFEDNELIDNDCLYKVDKQNKKLIKV